MTEVPSSPITTTPTTKSERHLSVDALRGFALLGIIVVNIEYLAHPIELGWSDFTSTFDLRVRGLVQTFATFKIFPIFAMLFGYGFQLQVSRAGTELGARYRRRMFALIALGALHAWLFFLGDILVLYGCVGLGVYRVRDWPTEKLLRVAAWIYGLTTIVWIVLGLLDGKKGATTATDSMVDAVTNGSFFDVVSEQLIFWLPTTLFLFLIQGTVVIASYLVGMAIGRTDWLSNPEANRDLSTRALRWWPVGIAIAGASAWLSLGSPQLDTLSLGVAMIASPLVAAGWIAGVVRLPETIQRLLQPSGRMSLTVYLLESVIAAVLFAGYGFGLVGKLSPLESLGVGFAIWAALSVFAHVWMCVFRFGPLEWALRSVSYGKIQPLVRT